MCVCACPYVYGRGPNIDLHAAQVMRSCICEEEDFSASLYGFDLLNGISESELFGV